MKPLHIALTATMSAVVLCCSCGQSNTGKTAAMDSTTKVKTEETAAITIDTFSTFPPEIDGCSCYFSADSAAFNQKSYLYVSDFDKISFVKINGVLTKFQQTETRKISETKSVVNARSDSYELTIEITEGKQSGDETSLKTGVLTIKDKTGKTFTKTFYGECGC